MSVLGKFLATALLAAVGLSGVTAWATNATALPDAGQIVGREIALLPGAGSEDYMAPGPSDLSGLRVLTGALLSGDRATAETVAAGLSYELVDGVDTDGRVFVAARQSSGDGPRQGWGTIVVADEGIPVVVEVPHPVADNGTETIGLSLFRGVDARALLIAGTHRDANIDNTADPAHNPLSAFHAVHSALVDSGVVVVQPHGFSTQRHPRLTADVVVSSAQTNPTALATSITQQLAAAGIDACTYSTERCTELGGTSNEQALQTIIAGSEFIHLEISTDFRKTPDWATALTDPIATAITTPTTALSDAGRRGPVDVAR